MPSVRSSLSVTLFKEFATTCPSCSSAAVERPRVTRYSCAPSRNSSSTSTPARPLAPSRRIDSLSPRTAGGLVAVRLGPAQVELIVQRAGLVPADRRVVQVPRGGARHVEDELPHDLAVDRRLGRGDVGGDAFIELVRREPLPVDRRKIDVLTRLVDWPELHPGPGQMHEQVAFTARAVLLLVLQLAPRIRGHVLEAPRVPGILLDFPRHVIVTKSDVIPLSRGQILELDRRSAVLHGAALLAQARKL